MFIPVKNPYKLKPWPDETHLIVNTATNAIVQFDNSWVVERACAQLNEHEVRNGRPEVYKVYRWMEVEIV